MKKILVATIVILSFFGSSLVVTAAPTYNITLNPSSPAPLSTVTFTADISGVTISGVYLILEECKDTFCYADKFNESMTKTSSNQYQKEISLKHSDANNIEYWLVIKSTDGTWYDLQDKVVQKTLSTGGTNNSKKTPGFELIMFFVSIAVLLFIIRQKRIK